MLERGDEGELDRLALLVARLRCGVTVLDPELLVGVGLDPDRLDHRLAGAVMGVFLYSLVQGAPSDPFSLSGNAWHGWIVAILGGVLVLWAYVTLYPRKWWQ